MWIINKFSPAIKLTARLSCNTNNRRYTSLVQVLQNHYKKQELLRNNLPIKRNYGTDKSNVTSKDFNKNIIQNFTPENSSILPIALLDLNTLSNNSSKVLLIPLNWNNADEHSMRNTIISIFSKPKHIQQIEAFSRALKDIPAYQKDKDIAVYANEINKNIETEISNNNQKENLNLTDSQNAKINNNNNCSLNPDYLDRLALAVDKTLQQCCLNSMQLFTDTNLLGERIKGLKFIPAHKKTEANLQNSSNPTKTSSFSSILNIDISKINLNDISWHQKMPFPEHQTYPLTNQFLLNKKAYSTKTTALSQQKSWSDDKAQDSKMLSIRPKNSIQKVVTLTIRREASSSSSRSKCIANYDFPYLAKLFGTKDLLMSCDAYNQALIEAAKRRAALAECADKNKKLQNDKYSRPQVMSIKGCSVPKQECKHTLQPGPCPPPVKLKKQASGDCKKDDPCKQPECPNPCKDEMEKLERQKGKEMKKKINKMPSGCESPKCKKDDRCKNPGNSPCKKATNQPRNQEIKCSSDAPVLNKQLSGSCKKDDPCKPPECPNPCKDEMEKLKRQTEKELKRKRNKTPTGCVSPKCKKEDACTKRKENPCKKASDCNNRSQGLSDSQSSLKCSKKGGDNKGKSDSCGSAKDKKPKNPCLDEHNDYKPKCNIDPCKKDGSPCGGAKKAPAGPSAKKKADSCGGCGKKEEPCKKDKKKEDPCKKKSPCGGSKKENPCKKKEKSDPCGSKKKDPCQNRKSSPCGTRKEDPCKKKKDEKKSPCGSKKEDPCKKKSPCGSKQEDPCKKDKEDPCKKKSPCGSKKEDPCKKKSPCGSKQEDPCKKDKEDPCKKKSPCGSKQDDPCKKKKSSPCVSDKKKDDSCSKKPTSPCKSKKESKSKCQNASSHKNPSCGKQKRDTKPNCGKNKKCYSTLAVTPSGLIKRTFASLTNMPSLKNKNFYSFGFMRHYSSKSGDNKKKSEDLGRSSQCKSVATNVPPKRKPAYNPHPKDGLRKCYPTYDMECKKLCRDARETNCKKYDFLKDTDNNKRNSNK